MKPEREISIEWRDRDTYETVSLAAEAYGLSVKSVSPISGRRANVVLAGRRLDAERLLDDMRSLGAAEPFATECPPGRGEYLKWLETLLKRPFPRHNNM